MQPSILYGTAWKGDNTTQLVKMALMAGFTGIDTANQPKHYAEALVGAALLELQAQGLQRNQLFLQTKFTPLAGHDIHIPYDPATDVTTQVYTSFMSSLEHLHTDHLDAYLLHAPHATTGLDMADWEAWEAIETLYEIEKVKFIGISNVNLSQLQLLVTQARIKPMIVQNRCFANLGWDKAIRNYCLAQNIAYQGFSVLTANHEVVANPKVKAIAARVAKTPAQIVLYFAQHIGITPLSGTCNQVHMQQDLQLDTFELTSDDIAVIETLSEEGGLNNAY